MATLKCNACGGAIASNARRVQCPHCAALFPFACAQCGRNLRPPFAESADERYLTRESDPRPLCEEHYLRKCPDCEQWFGAHENPGYFRCADCAQRQRPSDESTFDESTFEEPLFESEPVAATVEGGVATATRRGAGIKGLGAGALILACAACALLGLVGWWLFAR